MREKGYYSYQYKQCKKGEDYEQCIEEFQDQEEGKKVISKVISLKDEPCVGCLLLVKVWADEEAEILLQVRSKYATT